MLNGYSNNKLCGSGSIIWTAREELVLGEINYEEFITRATDSAPSCRILQYNGNSGDYDARCALLIAKNYGGKRLYFPSRPKSDSELVNLIGYDNAKAICKHFATGEKLNRGAEFEIPVSFFGSRAKNHRHIDKMTKSGISGADIAHQLGISHRTVTRQRTRSKSKRFSSPTFSLIILAVIFFI